MFREKSIAEIHRSFLNGDLDPVAVAKESIARCRKFDPEFHAWVCFDPDLLIDAAKVVKERLVKKESLRLLEGIPIGVKDVFNTADFPTQMGSPLWQGFTPGNDARIVYYLRNAGGIVAGKTVTAEFAVHALNETINPHNPELTPGTSSSGSAVAVSLGMVPVALGTQTGASIIRPASFCGIYGFKPSFGLLPRTASLKTTDSLDTIGFFVSHPDDLRRVLDVTRVHGPNFPLSYQALKDPARQVKPAGQPWRVALIRTHTWDRAPSYAQDALRDFANKLDACGGVELSDVCLPPEMTQAHEVHATIYDKSLSYYFSEEYRSHERISPIMKDMIQSGERISVADYHQALSMQNQLVDAMDDFFSDYDVAICLSTAGEAPPRNVLEAPDPALMWTLTHLPALSVPIFVSPNGQPFGMQVVARKYNDLLMLDFISQLRSLGMIPSGPQPLPPVG
jgi:Asp-tRNA(Asn)/Glu-tRNA(Gln) amidotransferase A subunit family amidase